MDMKTKWTIALCSVVFIHAFIICLNITAFFALPLEQPWYVWVPLCTMIGRVVWGAGTCPLTVLENRIRRELGMSEIKGFVFHYFWPCCLK